MRQNMKKSGTQFLRFVYEVEEYEELSSKFMTHQTHEEACGKEKKNIYSKFLSLLHTILSHLRLEISL